MKGTHSAVRVHGVMRSVCVVGCARKRERQRCRVWAAWRLAAVLLYCADVQCGRVQRAAFLCIYCAARSVAKGGTVHIRFQSLFPSPISRQRSASRRTPRPPAH